MTTWIDRYPKIKEFYAKRKYSAHVGFGRVPAIVVIDFGLAWTDKTGESGLGSNLDNAVEHTVEILKVARAMKPKPPIIFTTMSYNPYLTDASPVLVKKFPVLKEVCIEGSKWDKLDARLERQPDEPWLRKKELSCFSGTPLNEILVGNGVDTVIITGCTTDACVRCTAIYSFHLGFHAIIPHDAVGSRDTEAAEWALLDMDLRYGDVVSTQEVIDYLKGLEGGW